MVKIVSGALPAILALLLGANPALADDGKPVPAMMAAATNATQPSPAPALNAAPPTAAKTAADEGPQWGILLRGGYYGVPDYIADGILLQHPKIEGAVYGAEFRYHGDGGARGIASLGIAVDHAAAEADGLWQKEEQDEPVAAGGDFTMTAVTVTGYWNLFPSWFLHPYVGIGIGAAYVKGSYHTDNDLVTVDAWFPALHVPVGLALELGPHAQLAAEVRFIDGISWGGAFQLRF